MKLIEERGCNIEYIVLTGKRAECESKQAELEALGLVNGNGDEFTYRIEES